MKRLFVYLMLCGAVAFGAVSTSTLTQVSANSVYNISTEFGPGVRGQHVTLYIDYTKGDETSVDMTIEWMPTGSWGSTDYYAVGERASDESAGPVTIKFDTTDKLMFRVKVPAATSRMYITTTYQSGTTGTFKVNAVVEKD